MNRIKDIFKMTYSVPIYSGTLAIEGLLRSLTLKKETKVLISSISCYSILEAILGANLTPVIATPKNGLLFQKKELEEIIKKEKINLDNSRIEKIVYELDFYLNSFGPIDSRHFVNFDSFPYVGYKWSKYLLVGIIRGFLNDKYVIEYTDVVNTKTAWRI